MKSVQREGWVFSSRNLHAILFESPGWTRFYLPIDLKGKTVLDVGAHEGGTARFFLQHGASKIIAIEPDSAAFNYLKVNASKHPITAYNKRFSLTDLTTFYYDFLKMDIEGYEEALLNVRLTKPAVVEIHGLQLKDKFQAAGWAIEYPSSENRLGYGCQCYGYWMCAPPIN
jgi:hypothetical protein